MEDAGFRLKDILGYVSWRDAHRVCILAIGLNGSSKKPAQATKLGLDWC